MSGVVRCRSETPFSSSNARLGAALPIPFLLLHRRLGRRQPSDRDTVGRTTDVIQAQCVAETDRRRIAAVLAADPDLEVAPRRAAFLDGDLHQPPDAGRVE